MNKLVKGLIHPEKIVVKLGRKSTLIPDKIYLMSYYKNIFGKKLNLKNPQTFNEKMQWLKLYNRKPEYTNIVDKYEVKGIVCDLIGNEYIIPTIGVWNSFDEIDFNTLPNKFILKCTHDSAGIVICKNKNELNLHEAKKKIDKCMKKNFFVGGREWPYKNVIPRIIAEEYIEDYVINDVGEKIECEIDDFKFFCFNGKMRFFKIDFDRFTKHGANYYDRKYKLMKVGEISCQPNYNKKIKIPDNIDKMISLVEKLAVNYPFIRVDMYNIHGKIYFGEMTFFPDSGFGKFTDDKYDLLFGKMLIIPR